MQRPDIKSCADLLTGDRVTELETVVQSRLAGQVRHFHVVVQNQGLVLRGIARSYYAKQLAQHAIMAATDLPIVANDIEVVSTDVLNRQATSSAPVNEEQP
jgi:hypothetical protein